MKTSSTAIVFLLFAFTTKLFLFGFAHPGNEPALLDVDGDEIRTGVEYYVVSGIWGAGGGGLAIGRATNMICPEVVVQRPSDLDNGTPVIFYNSDKTDDVVRELVDINIEFVPTRDKICPTSTVWQMGSYDPLTGQRWVILGGAKGNLINLTSWFKIEKTQWGIPAYKFKYCPSVCESCETICDEIGREYDGQQIRLALNKNGWPFVFRKAQSTKNIKQVVNAKQ